MVIPDIVTKFQNLDICLKCFDNFGPVVCSPQHLHMHCSIVTAHTALTMQWTQLIG